MPSSTRYRRPRCAARLTGTWPAALSVALCLCLMAGGGCASHHDRILPVREAFFAGQLDKAEELLDGPRNLRLRNVDVKQLDRSMVELAHGQPKDAERLLRTIRDRFDDLEQKSLAEEGASLLTDDNVRAYSGEDYERVLIRVFLALSNLMTDGGDAGAYALQITEKQQQIIDAAQKKHTDEPQAALAFKQVALGPYVRAMLAEQSPLTLDEAARARVQVASFAPEFRDAKADLQRAKFEKPLQPGMGVLYVFTLIGRGPVKEAVAEIPTQVAMLVADRIISSMSNAGLPPTLAPVWVPRVVRFMPRSDAVRVEIAGRPLGYTATIVDVGGMAEAQCEANFAHTIGRAVARRAVKKGIIWGVKEGTGSEHGSVPSLLLDAVGVAWEATETADTRCWSLLPDKIQVLRLELPAGEHELALRTMDRGAPVGTPVHSKIQVWDGRNTYVMGMFPDTEIVGELLVSGKEGQ